jgi:hypothetical protein
MSGPCLCGDPECPCCFPCSWRQERAWTRWVDMMDRRLHHGWETCAAKTCLHEEEWGDEGDGPYIDVRRYSTGRKRAEWTNRKCLGGVCHVDCARAQVEGMR